MIHQSARLFVSVDFIDKLIKNENENVVPVFPSKYTIFNDLEKLFYKGFETLEIQLPQKFNFRLLSKYHNLYNKIQKKYNDLCDVSDDSSLIYYFSDNENKLTFIEGLEENMKITTPLDVKIAEVIYEECSSRNWWK